MRAERIPDLHAQLAGAFAWWGDAGVDCVFDDAPTQWLAPQQTPAEATKPASPRAAARAEPPPEAKPAIALPPGGLETFTDWWMQEPALDDGRTSGRVPPRGAAGAALMVLVPEPEAEDTDRLLSGRHGRLLAAMLAAMGIAEEQAYLASALPRHTPMADWAALADRGFGKILARHVALVAPKRLIVFGSSILPLMENDPPNRPAGLRQFNHESGTVPLLAARDLATLLGRPRWKADLWQAWLDWTAEAGIG